MRRCWLFHEWGKWEQFKVSIMVRWALDKVGVESHQKRVCERCGKVQEECVY